MSAARPIDPGMFEEIRSSRVPMVAGVDEAGRGPLAGPVVAAAVVLDPLKPIDGLADSKKLGAARRESIAEMIRARALAWSVAEATVAEIDELNILHATMLAMQRAVMSLEVSPRCVVVDGNRCPELAHEVYAIVKGDSLVPAISAASILAKVARDRIMLELHDRYPQYGFDVHKGYPTANHIAALTQYGASVVHRTSFGPVRTVLARK